MDIQNKICLITGATSGIGKETALALAQKGAHIVFTSRNEEKGKRIQEELIQKSQNESIEMMSCELASFQSIRNFAKTFQSKYSELHILINNAGVWGNKFETTQDGIEQTFAVNHLAPFLLTNLLLDTIKKSQPARIINVSSSLHYQGRINFDNLEMKRGFRAMQAYNNSKLMNVLFTKELARRLEGEQITVNCLMPGVVATNLFNQFNPLLRIGTMLMAVTPKKGAETTIYLATSDEVENITGGYYDKKKRIRSSSSSYDEEAACKLWEMSAEYVKL